MDLQKDKKIGKLYNSLLALINVSNVTENHYLMYLTVSLLFVFYFIMIL